ncbi:DUF72 domain-containing protein [Actinomadura sp. 21ATH]|uniref:DUF72 domain-containing protein n=1 Tax=Actinomadura sp. 21ATH TaxID=1735444 RepID=UPI0035C16999
MPRILVGTASWTDRTLLDSGWYPPEARTPEERLRYYASRFPLVEVDSTYYGPPSERTVAAWRDRTPDGFTFNVKAFGLLTGHPTRPSSIYKDLRDRLPAKKNVYLKDVPGDVADEVWRRFLGALRPLHDAGRLGVLLFQFPQWFPIGGRNRDHILRVKERCAPMRVCVEFRNRTWMSEENREETLGFLAAHDLSYVGVDMPQGHPSSVPPVLAATADPAVVRFHGHSPSWNSKDVRERFAYLYGEDELRAWAERITGLAARTGTTHVLFNNCCADHSQRNAARLMAMVDGVRP